MSNDEGKIAGVEVSIQAHALARQIASTVRVRQSADDINGLSLQHLIALAVQIGLNARMNCPGLRSRLLTLIHQSDALGDAITKLRQEIRNE